LFREYTAADGIPGNAAQSVCEDAQGTLWVGTATGGLAYQAGDRFIPVSLTPKPDPLIESVTVCPDVTNGIWIGTLEGRIFRYANGKVHPVNTDVTWSFPLERLRDHVANAMMEDSQGRVWFCNGSGAFYFQNGVFSAFDRSRGFVDNIGVRAIAEGPPGTLWFGTEPGDVWQLVDDRLTKFSPPKTWPNARVSALLPDTNNSIWIGTLGDGLLHLKNGNFTRVTVQDGLPDNSITELLEDNEGNLWGGTYKGIFRASKEDLTRLAAGLTNEIALSVFGHFDGLPAQTYSGWFQPSCWRSHDGRLWFTTIKGLVVVNPTEVAVNHRPPPVIIEEMRVDGEPCDFNSFVNDSSRSLRIAPGRHYVEFRFTGVNLTAPDKLRFKWRLEGVEKNWHENTSQRTVGFGPLMPGNYRFQVFAANSDGIWNQTGAHVTFAILPFFWETWWFKTLLIATFCGGLALAATLGLHRCHRLELERIERRHAIERERTRIARDMHDEIGSKLARISYLSEIVKAEAKDLGPEEATVDSLSKTARDLLQSFDQMLWAVNPRNDSLERLSAYLNRYAAEYFQNAPICCRRTFPEDLPAVQLTAETRHNIFLAFQEALANVLQHSAATKWT
jgi:streptogramin lyase